MNKKIVFLPYDFDTAIGTNNEGSLVFSYNLEDIDQVGGADVFNGQQSVLWKNLREMFPDELKAMYKDLRSRGVISYDIIETAFENHQAVWPEALFNEDSYFKYIAPLVEKGSEAYLSMLQGSKAEQRKWWLYNRFKYIDSKYNSGEALTDVITLRGYAKANITLTPYADVYPTIKYGSYLVQTRGERNHSYELICPLDTLNDTEIYIYSASQMADIGDLSGLKVGYGEFAYATKIQNLIVGSNATGYTNTNLLTLYPGNSKLLKKVDARNCINFGTGEQKSLDVSGCSNIEEVYMDGTQILSVALPDGGYLKKLHLPGSITNLTIKNQTGITEFVCPDFSNITTLNLENVNNEVDIAEIAADLPTGCRVRLFNFYWDFDTLDDARDFMSLFDGCTGIDEHGDNVPDPQIFATIHVPNATGDDIEEFKAAYPDITLIADTVTYFVRYFNYDGTQLFHTESVISGGDAVGYTEPPRISTAQYDFTGVGWSFDMDAQTASPNVYENVTSNRRLYAAYSRTLRSYTVSFVTAQVDGGRTYQTETLTYGSMPVYSGQTPTSTNPDGGIYVFNTWTPEITTVTGNQTYTAVFNDISVRIIYMNGDTQFAIEKIASGGNGQGPSTNPTKPSTPQYYYTFSGWNANSSASSPDPNALKNVTSDRTVYAIYTENVQTYTITFIRAAEDGGGTLQTLTNVAYGTIPLYTGSEPTTTKQGEWRFNGWNPAVSAVTGNQTYTAVFVDASSQTRKVIIKTITHAEDDELLAVGAAAFCGCKSLQTVSFPAATSIGSYAFEGCTMLSSAYLPYAKSIGLSAFYSCYSLQTISFPSAEIIYSSAFKFCLNVISVSLPVVTDIGSNAFAACSKIESLFLPSAISVGGFAFQSCSKLATISMPMLNSLGPYAFQNCSALTTVSFPALSIIDANTFANCTKLISAFFSIVTCISQNAFNYCTNLTTVVLGNESIVATVYNSYAFQNASNVYIYVPDSLINDYKTEQKWSYFSSRIKKISELPQ